MPIQVSEIEKQFFLLKWQGDITIEEIQDSHYTTADVAKVNQYKAYVHIIDGSKLKSYPLELNQLWQVIKTSPKVFLICIINIPSSATVLVRMLNAIIPNITLQDYRTLETALINIRPMLATRNAKT